jgi:hypothetical protein
VPAFIAFHLPDVSELAVRLDFEGTFVNRTTICRFLGRALGGSMASGRIDHLGRERLLLTVGGTRKAARTAAQILNQKARDFGASGMTISQSRDIPAAGFDVAAAFAQGVN